MPGTDVHPPTRGIAADPPPAGRDAETWLFVPGLDGSGPRHWQTVWEEARAGSRRFRPESWGAPSRDGWVAALDRAIAEAADPVLLVAHSLGCVTVAHWADVAAPALVDRVAAALLVAPPDVERPDIDPRVRAFAPPPTTPLPFPAMLVASADDPYCSLDRARALALGWGADMREVGARGHLNAASGLGEWPQGRALLKALPRRRPFPRTRPWSGHDASG